MNGFLHVTEKTAINKCVEFKVPLPAASSSHDSLALSFVFIVTSSEEEEEEAKIDSQTSL